MCGIKSSPWLNSWGQVVGGGAFSLAMSKPCERRCSGVLFAWGRGTSTFSLSLLSGSWICVSVVLFLCSAGKQRASFCDKTYLFTSHETLACVCEPQEWRQPGESFCVSFPWKCRCFLENTVGSTGKNCTTQEPKHWGTTVFSRRRQSYR